MEAVVSQRYHMDGSWGLATILPVCVHVGRLAPRCVEVCTACHHPTLLPFAFETFLGAEFFEPPYEVRERGWGEFEASIVIQLKDKKSKPVTLFHMITLFNRVRRWRGKGGGRKITRAAGESLMMVVCRLSNRGWSR